MIRNPFKMPLQLLTRLCIFYIIFLHLSIIRHSYILENVGMLLLKQYVHFLHIAFSTEP